MFSEHLPEFTLRRRKWEVADVDSFSHCMSFRFGPTAEILINLSGSGRHAAPGETHPLDIRRQNLALLARAHIGLADQNPKSPGRQVPART
jgi:hypothetical protein